MIIYIRFCCYQDNRDNYNHCCAVLEESLCINLDDLNLEDVIGRMCLKFSEARCVLSIESCS